MRKITCNNNNGSSIVFGEDAFTPFLLAHVDGLYDTVNEISVIENAILDGSNYQSSRKPTRYVTITVTDKPGMKYGMSSRDVLRDVFAKGTKGTLMYEEDGVQRVTDYYVEKVTPGSNRLYMIYLVCPDPYFYDRYYQRVEMASWIADFEFPHYFKAEGEELGHKMEQFLANIVGTSPNPVGMIVTLTAGGTVVNPSVVNVTHGVRIALGEEDFPFTMSGGDELTIVTEPGKHDVYLTQNVYKVSVNQYITEDSEFVQIMKGDNYIGVNADSGLQNLSVKIRYRNRYEGC